jgi:hypothetical protein
MLKTPVQNCPEVEFVTKIVEPAVFASKLIVGFI